MNHLIKIERGQPVTTTLAIAEGTANTHESVIKLVRTYITDLQEFGEIRFEIRFNQQGRNTEYALLNEQQSSVLITYMRNSDIVRKFKVALVKGFFEMRDKLAATTHALPQTYSEALRALADESEKVAELQTKIIADEPKVVFAEAVRDLDGVCPVEAVAKTLGTGRNKFFQKLREDRVLMKNNLPYQKYIDKRYFTVVEHDPYVDSRGQTHPIFTPMVTGRGQVWLQRRYSSQRGA